MLRYSFNMHTEAEVIEQAVYNTLDQGIMTKDLNKNNYVSTSDFADAVLHQIA